MTTSKKPLESIYKESFFSRRKSLQWRAPIVCAALISTFSLSKKDLIVDAGCAIGEYVSWFRDHGFRAFGIEGSENAKKYFLCNTIVIADLRTQLEGFGRYDACISLEVAEHIEEKYSDIYISNLVLLSNRILITAAPQGQGGHYHVNCQPKEYWEEKFLAKNYLRNKIKENVFKRALTPFECRKEIKSYINNVLVFEMENYI